MHGEESDGGIGVGSPVVALPCSGAGASQWRLLGEALGRRHQLVAPEHYGSEAAGPWGGAHAFTPRFGVQYDVNARTRVKAAFASGGDEDGIQSVATFEDEQVVFRGNAFHPVAFGP